MVDVGASNVEDFVDRMRQYRGSHEDFDYVVVPTVPNAKQQRDTISTLAALAEIGVPPERLRLLFNMLESDDTPQRVFAGLFDYHAAAKSFILRPQAVMHVNEIYARLNGAPHGIREIINDPTDYKARLKTARDAEERLRCAQRISLKRLAAGVTEELDAAFAALFA